MLQLKDCDESMRVVGGFTKAACLSTARKWQLYELVKDKYCGPQVKGEL